jgi:hypothetical protein
MFSVALCCIMLQKVPSILCALSSVLMVLSLVSTWFWNLVQFAFSEVPCNPVSIYVLLFYPPLYHFFVRRVHMMNLLM